MKRNTAICLAPLARYACGVGTTGPCTSNCVLLPLQPSGPGGLRPRTAALSAVLEPPLVLKPPLSPQFRDADASRNHGCSPLHQSFGTCAEAPVLILKESTTYIRLVYTHMSALIYLEPNKRKRTNTVSNRRSVT